MPYNECLCLRGRGPAGTCGYRIWGKIGTQGWGKNSKPAVVAVKRDKECVCVWGSMGNGGGSGERDYHWGYLNILEM